MTFFKQQQQQRLDGGKTEMICEYSLARQGVRTCAYKSKYNIWLTFKDACRSIVARPFCRRRMSLGGRRRSYCQRWMAVAVSGRRDRIGMARVAAAVGSRLGLERIGMLPNFGSPREKRREQPLPFFGRTCPYGRTRVALDLGETRAIDVPPCAS